MIKIAFIVPVYNTNEFLDECISSLVKVKANKEIIIVDDCGSEDPKPIVKKYQNDKSIKYIKNKENLGLGFARNEGIKAASKNTSHFYFVDSDDLVDPMKIDANVHSYLKSGVSTIRNEYFIFDKKHSELKRKNVGYLCKNYKGKNHFLPLTAGGSFGAADVVKMVSFDRKIYEDVPGIMNVFERMKNNYTTSDIPTYHYRLRSSSISNSKVTTFKLNEFTRVMQQKLDFGYEHNLKDMKIDYIHYYESMLSLPKISRMEVNIPTILMPHCERVVRFKMFSQKALFISYFRNKKNKRKFFK